MKAKIELLEKNMMKLEIEVDEAKFELGMERSYKKNVGKYQVPGFRKGKVPRNILERNYGEQVLYEDAVELVYHEAYEEAIIENNIEPVDYPEVDVVQIGKGKNFIFTAKVTTKPEVTLGQYTGVEVEKIEPAVTDEEIMADIDKERNRNSRITKIEEGISKMGDICVIDFEGFLEEVAFEGGAGKDYPLTLGSNSFIPGFEEQLVGKEIGQEVEVNVTFPEEYHKVELAGKPVVFKVKINELKEKQLPELNDEFAQDISEFDTFEEYKKSIQENLLKKAQEDARIELENKVVEKIVEASTMDVPEVMIQRRIDSIVKEFDQNLRYQGMELKKYLELTGGDYAGFRKRFEERALREVKVSLTIEKIAKEEKFVVSEEEIKKNIEDMAVQYGDTYENMIKHIGEDENDAIKQSILFKKTIDFLVDNAKFL